MSRILLMQSSERGEDRFALARELAHVFSEQGRQTLLIALGDSPDRDDPVNWVPRFMGLSPTLIRNYLAGSDTPYGQLRWHAWPLGQTTDHLLSLVREAFEWILICGADDLSHENPAVIDASDLLVWIARPGPDLPARWDELLQQVAKAHLPHPFARVVINRNPGGSPPASLETGLPSGHILAELPEEAAGLARRQTVRTLAATLENQKNLYRDREKRLQAKGSADQVVKQVKQEVQPQLLQALKTQPAELSSPSAEAALAKQAVEGYLAAQTALGGSREERHLIATRVLDEVLGLGPLEPLLKDPEITEILVNRHDRLYVEKKGKLHPTEARFSSENQLRTIIDRIIAPIGRRVDESMPLCDARLADGSRVNIVLPPLALDGAAVTIRKFSNRRLDLQDLVQMGSLSEEMADFLTRSVRSRQNIIVAGGTGSGKTTLLNALSSVIGDDERIVTIEDAAELRLQKSHVVRLESRPPNAEGQGAIPIRRLVVNALRMRPDRIVIGECRGGEALDMLQAMNTGHDGSLTTLHANAPRDALGRLETLVLMAGIDLPVKVVREQIRSAVHLIIQQSRLSDGSRKIVSITEITGMEGETLTTQELFRHSAKGFQSTGLMRSRP